MVRNDSSGTMKAAGGWDLVVVGAGPVGCLIAGAVARQGARVLVLERETDVLEQTRASTLNARTMEILSTFGVPGLADLPCSLVGHYGGIPVSLDEIDSPWAGLWKIPQPDLVRLLRKWATGNGAAIRTGVTFTRAQASPSATLSFCAAGPAFEGRYLVGADGADSTVRTSLAFTQNRVAANRHMIRCDVKGIDVASRRFERHGNQMIAAGEVSPGITRLMLFDPRYRATDVPAFEDVCRDWLNATGERIDGGECTWLDQFSNGCSIVVEWGTGRVFLAGDAAHDQPPVGGHSLNVGIQDAHNLAWKLSAALRGAPCDLTATYGRERAATTLAMQDSVRDQEALLFSDDQAVRRRGAAIRDRLARSPSFRRRTARSISGLDTHYLGTTQTGPRISVKQLGTVLGRPLQPSEEAAIGQHGLIVVRRESAERARVAYPGYGGANSGSPDVFLIVRPDGHVAWAPGHPDVAPDSVIKRWFGSFLEPVIMHTK
jgi:2-polyprenyl-6-methoxyphenol hydroxylase-like FAD-dependent oxidoreductase